MSRNLPGSGRIPPTVMQVVQIIGVVGVLIAVVALIFQILQFQADRRLREATLTSLAWQAIDRGHGASYETGQTTAVEHLANSVGFVASELSDLNLYGAQLGRTSLAYAKLTRVRLYGGNVRYGTLRLSSLYDVYMKRVDITAVQATDSEIVYATIASTIADRANFSGATLSDVDFLNSRGNRAVFAKAKILWSDFRFGDFEKADFSNALLVGVHFPKTNLRHAKFDGAVLIGVDFSNAENLRPDQLMSACWKSGDIHLEAVASVAEQTYPDGFPAISYDKTLAQATVRGSLVLPPGVKRPGLCTDKTSAIDEDRWQGLFGRWLYRVTRMPVGDHFQVSFSEDAEPFLFKSTPGDYDGGWLRPPGRVIGAGTDALLSDQPHGKK